MATFRATITVNMENGQVERINRTIDATGITTDEIDMANRVVLDAWLDYLFRETDLYKIVKNSSITIEERVKIKGE